MKANKSIAVLISLALLIVLACGAFSGVFASDAVSGGETASSGLSEISAKAISAAAVVAVVAAAGAIGMALAIRKSTESMARQPEVSGKVNSAMMLGLVFIETTIIYALIVAILIIFVL